RFSRDWSSDVCSSDLPELRDRRDHLLRATREEEERFLSTIDSGMSRFDEIAPPLSESDWSAIEQGTKAFPVIAGQDVFRLYDTRSEERRVGKVGRHRR